MPHAALCMYFTYCERTWLAGVWTSCGICQRPDRRSRPYEVLDLLCFQRHLSPVLGFVRFRAHIAGDRSLVGRKVAVSHAS